MAGTPGVLAGLLPGVTASLLPWFFPDPFAELSTSAELLSPAADAFSAGVDGLSTFF
jgi:hypothetical protein